MTAPAFDRESELPSFLRHPDPFRAALSQAFRPRILERSADPEKVSVPREFGAWMAQARPELDWTAKHFRKMQGVLDRMTTGEIRRAFFQIAIRHGKTEHNSIGYATYRLEDDPRFRWIVASYNLNQAQKLSREIRKLTRARGILISEDRDTAGEWETAAGGGVRAVGAGSGVASVNADGIIIDDPLGSREDAESQAKRDQVWDWITNDLLARTEPHTIVLMSMSRWHKDDPAGRLIEGKAGSWEVLDLPGRAEPKKVSDDGTVLYEDALGREEGEPLWPEFRGEQWLDEKATELGSYGFASLVQGRPRPREGGMFKTKWWQDLPEAPSVGHLVRYWDLAGTKKKQNQASHDPDWTAGPLLCRMHDDRTAIVRVDRFRESVAQRDAKMVALCKSDVANYRNRQIAWWIETETGIEGERRTADLVKKLQACGMAVHTEHPTGNKVYRAEPLASAAEVGNLLLCPDIITGDPATECIWRDDFIEEAADFPNGNHDDQIDGAGGAYSKLSDSIGAWGSSTWSM